MKHEIEVEPKLGGEWLMVAFAFGYLFGYVVAYVVSVLKTVSNPIKDWII